jgi:hypothetical protein
MKVTGSKLKTIKVSGESKQKEATRFNLNLILEDRGKWNTVNFKLLDSENETTWPSNIGVYRGIARDLSLRMIGVLDSSENSMLMLGEISFQQWFESVFGWENPYLAHQRWGIGLKYFQTLSKPESSDKISSAVFDLKFRLNKGIWGWDPTFGLIFSFQNFSSIGNDGDITYSMLGIGGFWARSMPKFVDDIFNIIPFLRYPKWVDVEFIYYPIGLDNAYELGPNMNLNFHGKIQWTSFFHGEAGFGMKQYFADKIGETEYKLGTFYATLGFGLSF